MKVCRTCKVSKDDWAFYSYKATCQDCLRAAGRKKYWAEKVPGSKVYKQRQPKG